LPPDRQIYTRGFLIGQTPAQPAVRPPADPEWRIDYVCLPCLVRVRDASKPAALRKRGGHVGIKGDPCPDPDLIDPFLPRLRVSLIDAAAMIP
jgi:hypothetical protein